MYADYQELLAATDRAWLALDAETIKSVCACPWIERALALNGADRDRTDNPCLAKAVLSQLSYGPVTNESVGVGLADDNRAPRSHPARGLCKPRLNGTRQKLCAKKTPM